MFSHNQFTVPHDLAAINVGSSSNARADQCCADGMSVGCLLRENKLALTPSEKSSILIMFFRIMLVSTYAVRGAASFHCKVRFPMFL